MSEVELVVQMTWNRKTGNLRLQFEGKEVYVGHVGTSYSLGDVQRALRTITGESYTKDPLPRLDRSAAQRVGSHCHNARQAVDNIHTAGEVQRAVRELADAIVELNVHLSGTER